MRGQYSALCAVGIIRMMIMFTTYLTSSWEHALNIWKSICQTHLGCLMCINDLLLRGSIHSSLLHDIVSMSRIANTHLRAAADSPCNDLSFLWSNVYCFDLWGSIFPFLEEKWVFMQQLCLGGPALDQWISQSVSGLCWGFSAFTQPPWTDPSAS